MKRQKFDPTKPVETRDGRPARIIATDRKHEDPIVALIMEGDEEDLYTFRHNGSYFGGAASPDDLVNVPERAIQFANVYLKDAMIYPDYSTKAEADVGKAVDRSFVLKITSEDGKVVAVELA